MDGKASVMHIINGKGYHKVWLPLHLISIGINWVALRFTLFNIDAIDINQNYPGFLICSIVLALCLHMIAIRKVLTDLAGVSQMIAIFKKLSVERKLGLSDNEISGKVRDLMQHGRVSARGENGLSLITLEVDDKIKELVLKIQ